MPFLLLHIVDSTFHQPKAGPPLSPERKMCCILPLISFCILADINLQLTVFSSLLSFMYPLHVLLIYYAFPYPNKEESIRMTDI